MIGDIVITRRSLVATLNPATMDTLGLFRGDTIIVRCVHYVSIFVPFDQQIWIIVARSGGILSLFA